MDDTEDLIARTEQVLAQVEALHKVLVRLQGELSAHAKALRDKLDCWRSPAAVEKPVPTPAAPPDRRTSPRRKGNLVAVLISDAQGAAEPIEGWVVDRSPGGLGLLVDEEMAVGSVVTVRPGKARSDTRWIQVQVKSCRRERNSWNLGCQFVQKPAWSELRWFG